jgi:hypothetical protein
MENEGPYNQESVNFNWLLLVVKVPVSVPEMSNQNSTKFRSNKSTDHCCNFQLI